MLKENYLGDKAQVGETVTWFIATIIIIVILFSSIFLATIGPWGNKELTSFNEVDYIASKSFFAWLLTEDEDGMRVYDQLKNEENLNDFNGELALDIFRGFYGEEYNHVWIGLNKDRLLLPSISNEYFGRRATDITGRDVDLGGFIHHVSEKVFLNENRSIEIVLSNTR